MPSPILLEANSGSLPALPPHRNPGLEIVFIERGHLRWEIEGRMHDLVPGSVFFTFPWERHGSVEEFEPGHRWQYVILAMNNRLSRRPSLPPDLAFSRGESEMVLRGLRAAGRRHWIAGERIPWLIRVLIEEFRSQKEAAAGTVRRLAAQLLMEMAGDLSRPVAEPPFATSTVRRIRLFLEELERHPDVGWTLDGMAARCKVRRSHLAEIVLFLTGDSPITHHRRLRIQRARTLLRETEKSITEIGHDCGFFTSQHFARIFRQFSGCTASTYRLRHRA
jgi:AraC family 4-hydroxyphenylacetate 3-monooxygenase operon regulatory protein